MKREIFISKTNYRPVMDYIFECRKKTDYSNMLNSTKVNSKESEPYYEILDVSFNYTSRIAKITIYKTVKYRTIEKYITRNYVKYPVYSSWKSKNTEIKKSVRLTNSDLENLLECEDELTRKFAHEIVYRLDDPELFPSWYLRYYYKNELSAIVDTISKELSDKSANFKNEIVKLEEETALLNKTKIKTQKQLTRTIKKHDRINHIIEKMERSDKKVFLCIITFGIYCYFISDFRKTRLVSKRDKLKLSCEKKAELLDNTTNSINDLADKISELNDNIKKTKADALKKISDYKAIYEDRISSIQPLETDIDYASDDFIPLKSISALNKEQIIGCYIIRNKENGKCYVGQSKDVLKRIRQHFKGTVPINIIFAKDYYLSTYENKNDLFSVKIIPCRTKDELDSTERRLIDEYGARETGYNSTTGNK